MRRLAASGLWSVLVLLCGCAEVARPPGGPIDRSLPVVLAMTPDSLAVSVDPQEPVTLTFSEKIAQDSVKEWLVLTPYRRVDDYRWEGKTLTFLPRGGWPPDTTITIELGSNVSDRSLNLLGRRFQRTFATADSVAPGAFSGRIVRSRAPEAADRAAPAALPGSQGAGESAGRSPRGAGGALTYLWVYRAPVDSFPDPARDTPDYQTEVEPEDRFHLPGIAPGSYYVFAVQDGDRRRAFSRTRDYATRHPDTLRVDATRAVWDDLKVFLINPKEPGTLTGRLVPADTTAGVDTLAWGVLVSPAAAEGDTANVWPPLRVSQSGRVESGKGFRLSGIAAGRWLIAVWLDANRDARWNSDEPVGPPTPVVVEPTAVTETPDLPRPAVPLKPS